MGERTGLGVVETAVLRAVCLAGMRPDAIAVRCDRIVDLAESEVGAEPRFVYDALCALAQSFTVPIPLIDFHGNCGSADDPPASPRYTEARLSPAGVLAAASDRGDLGPLPLGLINGNTHLDGNRPPLRPEAVVDALEALVSSPTVSDAQLQDMIGLPAFPTGCQVSGDFAAMYAGEATTLELSAELAIDPDLPAVVMTKFPPGIGPGYLTAILDPADPAARTRTSDTADPYPGEWVAKRPELRSLIQASSRTDRDRLICVAATRTDLAELAAELRAIDGVTTRIRIHYPAPMATILRGWVDRHRNDDITTALTRLRATL